MFDIIGRFPSNNQNSSLDVAQLVMGFNTAVTQNGYLQDCNDFTGAGISSSQIIGQLNSLENTNLGLVMGCFLCSC